MTKEEEFELRQTIRELNNICFKLNKEIKYKDNEIKQLRQKLKKYEGIILSLNNGIMI